MRTVFVILFLLAAIVATVLGFGWVDDPDLVEDWPGWVGLALTFLAASMIPYERFNRS